MKPKHQRLIFISASIVFLCIATLLTLTAFSSNIVFFYSPHDLSAKTIASDQLIRIGGLVEIGTLVKEDGDKMRFQVGDGSPQFVTVNYQGLVPSLFREGQGVIAEGFLTSKEEFSARRILTKHDENYMPKEVVDALKKTGQWREPVKP